VDIDILTGKMADFKGRFKVPQILTTETFFKYQIPGNIHA